MRTCATRFFGWICSLIILASLQFVPASRAVSFTWDPSPDAATGKVLGYKLYYSLQNFVTLPIDVALNPAFTILTITNGTTVDVPNLTTGLTYFLTVTAFGADNQESPPSNILAYTAGQTTPLTVSITTPASPLTISSTSAVTVTATASGSVAVTKVEFFDGTSLLATKTSAPYTFNQSFAVGVHVLTAKATDANNATATSAPVTITSTASLPVNVPPTVAITSPASNSSFLLNTSVTITATAADSDGTITSVNFYDGSAVIGTRTTSPYSITISTLSAGLHSIVAKAADNSAAVTASAPVAITITIPQNALPTVALTGLVQGALLSPPVVLNASASDSDGTITSVEFFANSSSLGILTTKPYTISPNLISGTYTFKAKATDNSGAVTFSAPITATVKPPPPIDLTIK